MEYIAIKNWDKYQADSKGQLREGYSPWIKDWVDKESDYEYGQLTALQRYVYDALRRLRGRFGKNPLNDPTWVGRSTQMLPRDRAHIADAIRRLSALGLITIVDSATSSLDIDKNKSREEKSNVSTDDAPQTEIDTVEEPSEPLPVEEKKLSSPDQEEAAKAFLVFLGKPKAFINSGGSWKGQIQPLLATVPLDRIKAIMEFAVNENEYSAEYLRKAKDPMASFVKNFETLERHYDAREAGLKAKAKSANKIKDAGKAGVPEYKKDTTQFL